jgi:hypothetical protein
VRVQGTHKDGTYWAEEIVIWEAASKPPGKEVADMFFQHLLHGKR